MNDQTEKKSKQSVNNPFENKEKSSFKGRYHNDYSPRYHEAYDIYEKAKNHMRDLKKQSCDKK